VPPIETETITKTLIEKFSLTPDDANTAARLSDGNFVKALEYMDTESGKNGLMDNFIFLMRAAFGRKIFDIEKWVGEMSSSPRDVLKNFFVYSIGFLRDSFLYNFHQPELVFLSQKENDFISKFSPFITNDNVWQMVKELELAYDHIEQNGNTKIILFDMSVKFITLFKN
jgi:DNA polymerase-3 subunit delta'